MLYPYRPRVHPDLTRIGPHTWDSPRHLLYKTDKQASDYDSLVSEEGYNSFHRNTVALVKDHAAEISDYIGVPFTLIDLGPAFPDKTLPLMKDMKSRNQSFDYIPVDINMRWMQTAAEAAAPYARDVCKINALFEKCAAKINPRCYPRRFAFVGLTFMNYEAQAAFGMVKSIAGRGNVIGIAQELITDEQSIKQIYDHYQSPTFKPLSQNNLLNLGVRERDLKNFEYFVRFPEDRCIEIGFTLRAHNAQLGLCKNDEILTIVSHRRTAKELVNLLDQFTVRPTMWVSPDHTTALALGTA